MIPRAEAGPGGESLRIPGRSGPGPTLGHLKEGAVQRMVVVRGPGSLGQEADACAALISESDAALMPESELTRPPLDQDRLRELLMAERGAGAPTFPPSPVAMSRLEPSPVAGPSPFEKQVPIYLLPDQASAQAGFLVQQQSEPLLAAYLRRLFQFAPAEGG